tara:strand:+ start:569 stop:976 length:408 start_codon:yes stop_codon:yes gene_type:complete
MIKKIFILIISVICFQYYLNVSYAVDPEEILKNTKQETRARNISKNIRCMICQNQSIDESSASLAKDLRILIRTKIKEGKTDKEIYKFLTDRYGDFILLKPPLKSKTVVLWFLPFVLFFIGLIFIYHHNKKSNKI